MAMCIELLEQRIAQLETQQRQWKYRFFVLLSLMTFSGVLLGAGVSRTGKFDQLTVDKLTARSIELKDAEGRMTHVMGSLSKHSNIKGSSGLELYPGPYFYMYDPSGKHRTFRINQGYRGQLVLRMSSPTKPYDFNVLVQASEGQGAITLFSDPRDTTNRSGVAAMTASRSTADVTVKANGKRLMLNAGPDRLGGTNLNLGGPGIKEQYWPQR
ncbi:MAG: hypothetical protein O3C40_30710 [Planctomycetota bacterium]|nr:hypothetical protein [Planctomycetota bacterium]